MPTELFEALTGLTIADIARELRFRGVEDGPTPGLVTPPPPPVRERLRRFATKDLLAGLDIDTRVLFVTIYRADNRKDVRELTASGQLRVAEATAAVFNTADIYSTGYASVRLHTQKYGLSLNLCPSERFFDQECGARATAVLVAPQLVATSAHVLVRAKGAEDLHFVFGFHARWDGSTITELPASDVYQGYEVVGMHLDEERGIDWAVVRLNRAVKGRLPAVIRRKGRIEDQRGVYVIGHPCGLPAKFADDARVRENDDVALFSADLDTYAQNSGSPVFDAETDVLEGLLRGGERRDWPELSQCRTSVVLDAPVGRLKQCVRATLFEHLIPEKIA
ncbi:serine protease [Nannocystis sp. ILAH1]|uniref:trypsin-like serine peptidase n=1 Tax=unclassified Nannocystis TaxID=2627009 RepID=UPI002271992C|nr:MULTISPECIES: serine protease [unclassified Nannocystis]MCY0986499.1 serine protease [Nannocystis sp. ILAH1]MCY1071374.1 serine protease [Nannocystis sp. RBIL2]